MMTLISWIVVGVAAYWLYNSFVRRPKAAKDARIIDIEAVPVEELVYCQMCASKVKDDFKVCPHCGHTLKPKCDHCGRDLNREWRTCPYCETPTNPK